MNKYRRYAVIPITIIILGCTFFSWRYSSSVVRRDSDAKFQEMVSQATDLMNNRIDGYTNALYGAKGLFAAVSAPNRLQWNHYVDGVEIVSRYPGISSLLFAKRVPAEEKDLFISNIRNDTSVQEGGYPNFNIYPQEQKNDYYVLTYVEPPSGKEKKPGFDISSEPIRLEALVRAWKSGEPAATAPVIGEVSDHLTFSIYMPIYKNGMRSSSASGLIGYVAVNFPVNEFFDSMFGRSSPYAGVEIGIADNTVNKEPLVFMYNNAGHSILENKKNSLSAVKNISMAGRSWALVAQAPIGFGLNSFERVIPLIILCIGLLVTMAVALAFYGIYFRKGFFAAYSKAVRSSPAGRRHIDMFESMGDIYYKTDMDGIILEVSPAIEKYTGIATKDLIGLMVADLYPIPAERAEMQKRMKNDGKINDYTITLLGKGGKHIPVSLSAHVVADKDDEPIAIEGILRDISERVKKEEMLEERDEDLARINRVLENKEARHHHDDSEK